MFDRKSSSWIDLRKEFFAMRTLLTDEDVSSPIANPSCIDEYMT